MYTAPWTIEIRDAHGTLVYPGDTLLILRGKNKGETTLLYECTIKIGPVLSNDELMIQVKISCREGAWMDPDGFELVKAHPSNDGKPR
jgi:hypothetical protein